LLTYQPGIEDQHCTGQIKHRGQGQAMVACRHSCTAFPVWHHFLTPGISQSCKAIVVPWGYGGISGFFGAI